MVAQPVKLAPPVQDRPLLGDGGQHTQSWAQFHQSVADRLASSAAQLTALQATVDAKAGVTDGSDATAGQLGEFIEATYAAAAIADNTSVNLTSISLTAGDWDVSGTVRVASTTLGVTIAQGWVSTASATAQDPWRTLLTLGGGNVFGSGIRLVTMPRRLSLSSTTTVYLGAYVKNSGAGSSTVDGYIAARRVR